ncbi:hypothetical protein [Halorarius halobius]|uniref:hypothetical protein n=1 Tax=Halorarius halobius TaxID=2962671 RepID=UPI0020CEBC82|nr:hypothetical protein [Halorarius halobius]
MDDYRGSDGRSYDEEDVWTRLERGEWSVCCFDPETGLEVVETADDELLFLTPDGRESPTVAVES